jgi:hypothetical protein
LGENFAVRELIYITEEVLIPFLQKNLEGDPCDLSVCSVIRK